MASMGEARSDNESSLQKGARNAVITCMQVKPQDRVFIITDVEKRRIGEALLSESQRIGAETRLVLLEDYGRRPFSDLPGALKASIISFNPTVTFFAADGQPGEIKFRMPLLALFTQEVKSRHGHMIGIDERLMQEGMAGDYNEIARITQKVYDRVKGARTIRVLSKKGTDVTASFSESLRWKPCTGIYSEQGQWGNLPEGEVFTSPACVDGILVVDVIGDFFSKKYGVLAKPVTFKIANSFVTEIACENEELQKELSDYLFGTENGNRAGEFAIGTNTALTHLTGNLLQDEKIPGVHIAFGDPYPRETGADWEANVHVDVIPTDCDIWVDGVQIMANGEFSAELSQ